MARQRGDVFPRGYPKYQAGVHVAANSATALPLSFTAEWLFIKSRTSNTDTVWMGNSATVTSLTGFGFKSTTEVYLPMQATSLTLFFQSEGGSSVVDYIALGL